MQQVAQVEREKDEYKVQLQATKKELEEAANQQIRYENKISKLQQILRSVNEEKANLDAKLTQKQMTLQSVEDSLKLKSDEFNVLSDRFKSLELQLSNVSEQKLQIEVSFKQLFYLLIYYYYHYYYSNYSNYYFLSIIIIDKFILHKIQFKMKR